MEQEELKVGDWVKVLRYNDEQTVNNAKIERMLVTLTGVYRIAEEYLNYRSLVGVFNPNSMKPNTFLWYFPLENLKKVNIFQERVREIVNEHESENTSI